MPRTKYPPVLLKHVLEAGSETLDHYRKRGGYETWLKLCESKRNPDEVVEEVFKAGLRGRGGAGFPTGQKWKFLAKNDKPRYLVVNADESEPGTFKDKMLIDRGSPRAARGDPDLRLRDQGEVRLYLHPRRVRPRGEDRSYEALDEAEKAGLLQGASRSPVHRGAGAYICGEETGLLSSLEGNARLPEDQAAVPGRRRALRLPDDRQQRRDADDGHPHPQERRRVVPQDGAPRRAPA